MKAPKEAQPARTHSVSAEEIDALGAFYKRHLPIFTLAVNDAGMLEIDGGVRKNTPWNIQGFRFMLPTAERVNAGAPDPTTIFYHPLREAAASASDSDKELYMRLKNASVITLNIKFQTALLYLTQYVIASSAMTTAKPDLLVAIGKIDDVPITLYDKVVSLMDSINLGSEQERWVTYNMERGGTLAKKIYARSCQFRFPIYEKLTTAIARKTWPAKIGKALLNKGEIHALVSLYRIILPMIDVVDSYSVGTNAPARAMYTGIVQASRSVLRPINATLDNLTGPFPDLALQIVDIDSNVSMDDGQDLGALIQALPRQNLSTNAPTTVEARSIQRLTDAPNVHVEVTGLSVAAPQPKERPVVVTKALRLHTTPPPTVASSTPVSPLTINQPRKPDMRLAASFSTAIPLSEIHQPRQPGMPGTGIGLQTTKVDPSAIPEPYIPVKVQINQPIALQFKNLAPTPQRFGLEWLRSNPNGDDEVVVDYNDVGANMAITVGTDATIYGRITLGPEYGGRVICTNTCVVSGIIRNSIATPIRTQQGPGMMPGGVRPMGGMVHPSAMARPQMLPNGQLVYPQQMPQHLQGGYPQPMAQHPQGVIHQPVAPQPQMQLVTMQMPDGSYQQVMVAAPQQQAPLTPWQLNQRQQAMMQGAQMAPVMQPAPSNTVGMSSSDLGLI